MVNIWKLQIPSELPFSPLNSTEPSSFKDADPCLSISLAWHISIFFKRRTTTRCEDVTFPGIELYRVPLDEKRPAIEYFYADKNALHYKTSHASQATLLFSDINYPRRRIPYICRLMKKIVGIGT